MNHYLFNFAVSYSGGGYKRLLEYVKAFDATGGASFIIHPRCRSLAGEYTNNRYFFVGQPRYQRLFNDCGYLAEILQQVGKPDLYYSYGIPVYSKIGKVNWFHLSNVLPLAPANIPMSLFDHLKMRYLGRRIKTHYDNADVISAESNFSLELIGVKEKEKLFLSANGNDDVRPQHEKVAQHRADFAVVIGTYRYKAIEDSFRVFEMLRQQYAPGLRLVIIGDEGYIPKNIVEDPNVEIKGIIARNEVMACLGEAKYFVSTTHIENSSNATIEGIFLAEESYISDIGPHRELLQNTFTEIVAVPGMTRPVLHVKREEAFSVKLKPWAEVVAEMVSKTQSLLQSHRV